MTLTETPVTASRPLTFELVTLDLYRDIHKSIRSELFAVTTSAGRTDASDVFARQALATHVDSVMDYLVQHAHHEDGAIAPVMERDLPDLAAQIEHDHVTLERRIETLRDFAATAAGVSGSAQRPTVHRLYVELASFTSAYLAHQDLEERVVMPALETAVGIDAVVEIHGAIVGSIPPDEMARSLALMLPAMNIDDREELFAGMAATAPAEAVDGVWDLAVSVLDPTDVAALARRLGR